MEYKMSVLKESKIKEMSVFWRRAFYRNQELTFMLRAYCIL